jgi:hypothetical protein
MAVGHPTAHSLSSLPQLADDNYEQHNEHYSHARQEQAPQEHFY